MRVILRNLLQGSRRQGCSIPAILFAKDGEVYDLDGVNAIAMGGAYGVDKWCRLKNGYSWFSDGQPDDEVKARAAQRR